MTECGAESRSPALLGDTASCAQHAKLELLSSGGSWELDSPLVLGRCIRLGGSVFDFVIYSQSGFFLEATSHHQLHTSLF